MNVTQQKIPFSYYYDLKDVYNTFNATTTENMPSFSITLGDFDSSSSTPMGSILPSDFDFFSKETISTYLSEDMHDLLYLMMQLAIWAYVGFAIYNRIVPQRVKI